MVSALRAVLPLICAVSLFGQSQPGIQQQAPGMMTPWEIAPVLDEIGAHGGRLREALAHVDVKAWVEKGASETYLQQWQSSSEQARAVADSAKLLARSPEKLSAGLELLFRMQALGVMLGSLEEGMRHYQKPADAQQLAALAGEIAPDRERFERYLVGLAQGQEQQIAVMDKEAQRCRGMITAPAPPSRTGKKN